MLFRGQEQKKVQREIKWGHGEKENMLKQKELRKNERVLRAKGRRGGTADVSCGGWGGLSLPGRKCLGFIGFIWHDRTFLRCCRLAGKKSRLPSPALSASVISAIFIGTVLCHMASISSVAGTPCGCFYTHRYEEFKSCLLTGHSQRF